MATQPNEIEEFLPKQKRSRARRAAMIEAGERLLMQRDFDDISVADVTASVGYSTGSFYSGFPDKAAFFVAVQRSVNKKLKAKVDHATREDAVAGLSAADRMALTVDLTLDYFRERRGVIASALRHESRMNDAWAPHRASAQHIADSMIQGLSQQDSGRLSVAIQMAFGTMVNALLHDPGPLRLEDAKFGEEIKTALRPYLMGED